VILSFTACSFLFAFSSRLHFIPLIPSWLILWTKHSFWTRDVWRKWQHIMDIITEKSPGALVSDLSETSILFWQQCRFRRPPHRIAYSNTSSQHMFLVIFHTLSWCSFAVRRKLLLCCWWKFKQSKRILIYFSLNTMEQIFKQEVLGRTKNVYCFDTRRATSNDVTELLPTSAGGIHRPIDSPLMRHGQRE
jgi:hypothetical protein